MQQKIAVLGSTGKAGKYLVDKLLEQGYSVKALVRDPGKLSGRNPQVEIVRGNARNYDAVFELLQGCDAVISTLGPSKLEPDTCSMAVGHIIKAMQALKIKRYIELAGLAIDTPEDKKGILTKTVVGLIKLFFREAMNDRQSAYRLLVASDLHWTIVRSSMIELTDSRRGIITSLEDSPGRKVSSTDLALFLIDQLNDDLFVRKCPFVAS
jgi:putative NADH-flavin reductase